MCAWIHPVAVHFVLWRELELFHQEDDQMRQTRRQRSARSSNAMAIGAVALATAIFGLQLPQVSARPPAYTITDLGTLAGTLIQIGRGLRPAGSVEDILKARDRRTAGPCAPARGLVLEKVFYEEGT